MNVANAADIFISHYHNEGTRTAFRPAVKLLVESVGGQYALTALTSVDLLKFSQRVEAQPFAAATKRKYQKAIKTFCNWLVKMELLEKSPAKMVVPHRINTMVDRNKAIPDDDLRRVLDWARHQTLKRTYALLAVLADTGIRIGGASTLKIADIDLDDEQITVTEKGDKTRTIPIYPESLAAIRLWLLQRDREAGPVFFTRDGDTITSDSLGQVVTRACDRAGCSRKWGPHSFRHRKGKQMAAARVNPTVAAEALGNDVITYLQHYVGADTKAIRAALAELALPATAPSRIVPLPVERRSG